MPGSNLLEETLGLAVATRAALFVLEATSQIRNAGVSVRFVFIDPLRTRAAMHRHVKGDEAAPLGLCGSVYSHSIAEPESAIRAARAS